MVGVYLLTSRPSIYLWNQAPDPPTGGFQRIYGPRNTHPLGAGQKPAQTKKRDGRWGNRTRCCRATDSWRLLPLPAGVALFCLRRSRQKTAFVYTAEGNLPEGYSRRGLMAHSLPRPPSSKATSMSMRTLLDSLTTPFWVPL